ncbi:unnamed protein product [Didymodactylos carnosus]|uniref:Uncharacterized protein n=1 Tax=Didymodactylos carnosus TaxID=1234261 RepID=A0A815S8M3_9BILA|nr:unnamed protein product [Didymodactylos carnosus]CAF4352063.1 unnamed protein product [Didymodactylos carnosus]
MIKFYSKQNRGTYIIFATPEQYIESNLKNNSKTDEDVISFIPSKVSNNDTTIHDNETTIAKQMAGQENNNKCLLLLAIEIIRKELKRSLLTKPAIRPFALMALDARSFMKSVSPFLQNFISLITLNNADSNKFKESSPYFDFHGVFFQNYSKMLQVSSVCLDLLSCRDFCYISYKNILLSMVVWKLTGSERLISILNKFGHTSSSDTLKRLATVAAEQESSGDYLPQDKRATVSEYLSTKQFLC